MVGKPARSSGVGEPPRCGYALWVRFLNRFLTWGLRGIGPLGVCLLGGFMVPGCAGPGLEAGFDAPDPSARLHAVVEAGRTGDKSKIPQIVNLLDSDDAAVRILSICVLERLTGDTLGYDYAKPRSERMEAVRAWRARYPLTGVSPESPASGAKIGSDRGTGSTVADNGPTG